MVDLGEQARYTCSKGLRTEEDKANMEHGESA